MKNLINYLIRKEEKAWNITGFWFFLELALTIYIIVFQRELFVFWAILWLVIMFVKEVRG